MLRQDYLATIHVGETQVVALETSTQTLDNTKAAKLVGHTPLFHKKDAPPNELYAEQPPPPISANAIVFNGTDGYIDFLVGEGM